jgi:hypothetical protein
VNFQQCLDVFIYLLLYLFIYLYIYSSFSVTILSLHKNVMRLIADCIHHTNIAYRQNYLLSNASSGLSQVRLFSKEIMSHTKFKPETAWATITRRTTKHGITLYYPS